MDPIARPIVFSWTFVKETLGFPILVSCTAMSMVILHAGLAMSLGLHRNPENFLLLVVGISGAVIAPVTIFAFFRETRKYAERLMLRNFATTDPLTGALNRRAFRSAAETEQKRMARSQKSGAIILFDLDHFKSLNDTHGHVLGDHVLKSVSVLAHSEMRGPFDQLGRWGGEEFIIFLNHVSSAQAKAVAERLRLKLEAHTLEVDGQRIGVTASFGVAFINANFCFDQAMSLADTALYEAKATGRNRVVESAAVEMVA